MNQQNENPQSMQQDELRAAPKTMPESCKRRVSTTIHLVEVFPQYGSKILTSPKKAIQMKKKKTVDPGGRIPTWPTRYSRWPYIVRVCMCPEKLPALYRAPALYKNRPL